MSADILRQAAGLMRERAAAATHGPWGRDEIGDVWMEEADGQPVLVSRRSTDDDAAHIASWHPTVALAVADWLDRLHVFITDFSEYDEDEELTAALNGNGAVADWPEVESALNVAYTYLGKPRTRPAGGESDG